MQLKVSYNYEVGFTIKINNMSFSAGNQSPSSRSSRIHQVGSWWSMFGSTMLGSHSACAQIPLFELEKWGCMQRYIDIYIISMPHRRAHTEPPHLQLEWVPSIVLPAQQVQTQQLRQNLVAKAPLHHQNHQMSWAQMDIPWQRMALGSKRIQRGYKMMFSGHWISNKILQHRLPCQQHRPGKATTSYKQNMKIMK